MIFSFQLKTAQWTMPSSATISNRDISINLGYHGNLKNVSLETVTFSNCKKHLKMEVLNSWLLN